MADRKDVFSYPRIRSNFVHISIASVLVLGIFYVHNHFIKFDRATVVTIVFFNLLFLFLLFPLESPFLPKIVLLIAGNHLGAFWYLIQLSLGETFAFLGNDSLKIITIVAKPLIDFVWIVAVWSISLSVLTAYRIKSEGLEKC